MAGKKRGARVLGPYPCGDGRYRVVSIEATGERADSVWPTEKEAEKQRLALIAELAQPCETVELAIQSYRAHQVTKGNRPKSYKETERRLRLFFADALGLSLDMLTPKACAGYYGALTVRLAPDSHRNMLAEAKTWLRWCQDQGWIGRNPLAKIEGVGGRTQGKPQLRVEESRRLVAKALELALADGGDRGAVGTLCAFLLSLRAGEVVERVARDVDEGGRLLWIDRSKTKAGERFVEVPAVLSSFLEALAASWPDGTPKRPEDPLLGRRSKRGRIWRHGVGWLEDQVERIRLAAGVPKVTPHGLRGTHATLARGAGASGIVVAATMGHESPAMTEAAYARPEAVRSANAREFLRVLTGGKG